jgi:hypothetical protein
MVLFNDDKYTIDRIVRFHGESPLAYTFCGFLVSEEFGSEVPSSEVT